MGGSNLRMGQKQTNLIEGDHRRLSGRTASEQHPMDSIYRLHDKKPLPEVLKELERAGSALKFEYYDEIEDGQTVLKLTKFQYNPLMDRLLVSLCGVDVHEGVEKDFIQSGVDEITFNYPLKSGYEVLIILGGTITSESFGSAIDGGISLFRQLMDTPNTYSGMSGKVATVSDNENGIIFTSVQANTNLTEINSTIHVEHGEFYRSWLEFVPKGMIKGIKMSPSVGYAGDLELKIFTKKDGGHWVYYSGTVRNILWDIMDIPFIDESGLNAVFIEIENRGNTTDFFLQIYVIE